MAPISTRTNIPTFFCILLLGTVLPYVQAGAHRLLEEDHDHDSHDEHSDHDSHDEEVVDEDETPWGRVIGTTFLINLTTLTGVIALIPLVVSMNKENRLLMNIGIPSFAVGALIAVSVFLVIPESLHLIQDGVGNDEKKVNLYFGLALIGGFLIPSALGMLFENSHITVKEVDVEPAAPTEKEPTQDGVAVDTGVIVQKDSVEMAVAAVATKEVSAGANDEETANSADAVEAVEKTSCSKNRHWTHAPNDDVTKAPTAIDSRLCASILLGDAFHNFADGMFIGAAFTLCDSSVAFSMVFATLYHELAQELADFFLLTRHGMLPSLKALLANFLSGLTVMLGGIVILTAGDIADETFGVILALAAGVYINIAGTECMPRVQQLSKTMMHRVFSLGMIVLGVVPIALVLQIHEHCEDSHEDHDH